MKRREKHKKQLRHKEAFSLTFHLWCGSPIIWNLLFPVVSFSQISCGNHGEYNIGGRLFEFPTFPLKFHVPSSLLTYMYDTFSKEKLPWTTKSVFFETLLNVWTFICLNNKYIMKYVMPLSLQKLMVIDHFMIFRCE